MLAPALAPSSFWRRRGGIAVMWRQQQRMSASMPCRSIACERFLAAAGGYR